MISIRLRRLYFRLSYLIDLPRYFRKNPAWDAAQELDFRSY